ncbi:hypothetical protein IL306_004937 [Fusarium sp. DS 682]|nr:hypothetical protein IL306_004937 [Fusarium sp. DS 682]
MDSRPRAAWRENREKWWNELWENRVKELPLLPDPRPRAVTPRLTPDVGYVSNPAPRPLYQESCPWFKVPPNIRRDILRLAFGDTRLHIYMDYGYPDLPRRQDSKVHCRIATEHGYYARRLFRATDDKVSIPLLGVKPITRNLALTSNRSYMEAIDVLYSTNTLLLGEARMIARLPKLLVPQHLELVSSLEITWTLKTCCTPNQDYDEMDQDHLKSIFDLLAPSTFPALRRLYIWFAKDPAAWLSTTGLVPYEKLIFRHLDSFVQDRDNLKECAFALPRNFFVRKLMATTEMVAEERDTDIEISLANGHRKLWRDVRGNMTVLKLPYVDSYPRPPYHLSQRDNQVAGYWVLESPYDDLPGYRTPVLPSFCTLGSQDPEVVFGPRTPRNPSYSPASPTFTSPSSPRSPSSPDHYNPSEEDQG